MGNSMGNYHPRRATKRQIWGGASLPHPRDPVQPQSVRPDSATHRHDRKIRNPEPGQLAGVFVGNGGV